MGEEMALPCEGPQEPDSSRIVSKAEPMPMLKWGCTGASLPQTRDFPGSPLLRSLLMTMRGDSCRAMSIRTVYSAAVSHAVHECL